MSRIFSKISGYFSRAGKKMDQYQSGIAFAEAGQHKNALDLIANPGHEEDHGGKLLVIGRESEFSDSMMDYAIEMAQRMKFDIIAMNTMALSNDVFKNMPGSRQEICREFETVSQKNVQLFAERAKDAGISFLHEVKFIDPDTATKLICKEHGTVDFVISEPDEVHAEQQNSNEIRPRNEMFVYSVL